MALNGLAQAECMRAHGITGYPSPGALDGGLHAPDATAIGLDTHTPQFAGGGKGLRYGRRAVAGAVVVVAGRAKPALTGGRCSSVGLAVPQTRPKTALPRPQGPILAWWPVTSTVKQPTWLYAAGASRRVTSAPTGPPAPVRGRLWADRSHGWPGAAPDPAR